VIHGVRRDDSGNTLETVRRALNKADTCGAGVSLQTLNKVLLLLSLPLLPLSALVLVMLYYTVLCMFERIVQR
jgi:hypothetical protein